MHNPLRRRLLKRAPSFSPEYVNELFDAVERLDPNPERTAVILGFGFFCGLRAQEIAGLQYEVNLADARGNLCNTLTIYSDIGKGGEWRTVPIPSRMFKLIERLREMRPDDRYIAYPTSPKSTHGDRMSPNAIAQFYIRALKQYGFSRGSSHSGRRTFGTQNAVIVAREGGNLKDVQILLGHANLKTTEGYIDTTPNHRRIVEGLYA